MFHTQEKRSEILTEPIMCKRKDAWLGDGYYFWKEEVDAIHWGNNSKQKTGSYQIYSADLDCSNFLDTVFNEKHYEFWLKQIEKAAKYITKKTGNKPTIKEINQYFRVKAKWNEDVDGILFQDLPVSEDLLVLKFYYRKRIQAVVYHLDIINSFALHLEMDCN